MRDGPGAEGDCTEFSDFISFSCSVPRGEDSKNCLLIALQFDTICILIE
jgi:hypothetical protein